MGFKSFIASFRSSLGAWPEAWISIMSEAKMMAPWRARLSLSPWTLLSFPGITEAEKITVSPGLIRIWRCSPFMIFISEALVSPWAPVERMRILLSRYL